MKSFWSDTKLHKFKLFNYDAILLAGRIEVSVPDEDVGSKIISRLGKFVLDGKIKSLRVNLPNKIVFITAKDKNHIIMRAEEANDKKSFN